MSGRAAAGAHPAWACWGRRAGTHAAPLRLAQRATTPQRTPPAWAQLRRGCRLLPVQAAASRRRARRAMPLPRTAPCTSACWASCLAAPGRPSPSPGTPAAAGGTGVSGDGEGGTVEAAQAWLGPLEGRWLRSLAGCKAWLVAGTAGRSSLAAAQWTAGRRQAGAQSGASCCCCCRNALARSRATLRQSVGRTASLGELSVEWWWTEQLPADAAGGAWRGVSVDRTAPCCCVGGRSRPSSVLCAPHGCAAACAAGKACRVVSFYSQPGHPKVLPLVHHRPGLTMYEVRVAWGPMPSTAGGGGGGGAIVLVPSACGCQHSQRRCHRLCAPHSWEAEPAAPPRPRPSPARCALQEPCLAFVKFSISKLDLGLAGGQQASTGARVGSVTQLRRLLRGSATADKVGLRAPRGSRGESAVECCAGRL